MERIIYHCDCNSFYCSVELLSHPELRRVPTAVCGDPKSRHGIILAKNEPAKRCGVRTAETIWQARQKCPDLVLLPAHQGLYREYSQRVNAVYDRFTDLIEPFGIDESWLDVTGSLHLFGGDPKALADRIRGIVREELGLTISVGVSFNKVFAKLGSDYKKPDATTVISRENFKQIVWPLPVTDLLFVGRAAARVLRQYGVSTIGDLAVFDRGALIELLGKQGGQLWEYANGLEHSAVAPAGTYTPPKSVGNGETFPRNLIRREEVGRGVAMLADQVAVRLRRHGMKASTLQVTIRDPKFQDICRQRPLPAPTNTARELSQAAMDIIARSWKSNAPIRAITLTAHNLIPEGEAAVQLDLFQSSAPQRRERVETLERTMDAIRSKYGRKAVTVAVLAPRERPEEDPDAEGALPF
ncbi:MAG: DNA polymerase IV [Oscillospiraceae bacterium]|nr:DNA polymerase IV [Oscillospiraceae bacterium]